MPTRFGSVADRYSKPSRGGRRGGRRTVRETPGPIYHDPTGLRTRLGYGSPTPKPRRWGSYGSVGGPTAGQGIITNELGQQIGVTPGGIPLHLLGGAMGQLQTYAGQLGQADLESRVNALFGPGGQLTRPPSSAQEAAMAQWRLEQQAAAAAQQAFGQAVGMLGGGIAGPAGGAGAAGTTQADIAPIREAFLQNLNQALEAPGMSQEAVENIISRGSDELARGAEAAGLGLRDVALASGARDAADLTGGLGRIQEDVGRQQAALGRDVRIAAEEQRNQQRMQALGAAGGYLGRVEDIARQDRNRLMELLLSQQFETPDFSNLIQTAGLQGGGGGGFGVQSGGAQYGRPSGGVGGRPSNRRPMGYGGTGGRETGNLYNWVVSQNVNRRPGSMRPGEATQQPPGGGGRGAQGRRPVEPPNIRLPTPGTRDRWNDPSDLLAAQRRDERRGNQVPAQFRNNPHLADLWRRGLVDAGQTPGRPLRQRPTRFTGFGYMPGPAGRQAGTAGRMPAGAGLLSRDAIDRMRASGSLGMMLGGGRGQKPRKPQTQTSFDMGSFFGGAGAISR